MCFGERQNGKGLRINKRSLLGYRILLIGTDVAAMVSETEYSFQGGRVARVKICSRLQERGGEGRRMWVGVCGLLLLAFLVD